MQNFNSSPFSIWNEDTKTLSDGLFFLYPTSAKVNLIQKNAQIIMQA